MSAHLMVNFATPRQNQLCHPQFMTLTLLIMAIQLRCRYPTLEPNPVKYAQIACSIVSVIASLTCSKVRHLGKFVLLNNKKLNIDYTPSIALIKIASHVRANLGTN